MSDARSSFLEILAVFTRLGLTSFGGPIAHLGIFRDEFVRRRGWLSDEDYADLVALTQFLPGPASSQAGFAIGVRRRGLAGGLAAFAGFTWPSALIMLAAAYGQSWLMGAAAAGLVNGLKIAAVAVVAHAVLGMARSLCPDRPRATIAVLAAAMLALFPSGLVQLAVIAAGLVAGTMAVRVEPVPPGSAGDQVGRASGFGKGWLTGFLALLIGLPVVAAGYESDAAALVSGFYRSGALVFGGGHVVLPLLETVVVPTGWVTPDDFLAGYGIAQAVPGPLFTFSTYLGAVADNDLEAATGAMLATLALFLPGFLLVLGALPAWERLRRQTRARAALAGVNAAVVGVLAAALYNPVWISAIHAGTDFALALLAFAALSVWNWPAWRVVLLAASGGTLMSLVAGS